MGPDIKPLTDAVQQLGTKLDLLAQLLQQILTELQKKE